MSPMLSGEFRHALEKLPMTRRKAIVFALETGVPVELVRTLNRQDAKNLATTPVARQVIASLPRHMKLPYAFWEFLGIEGLAIPLSGLSDDYRALCGPWGDRMFRRRYQNMLWVDSPADRDDLVQYLT